MSDDKPLHVANPRFLPPTPDWPALLAVVVGAAVCALLIHRAPFLGHDWYLFVWGHLDDEYPPWIPLLLLRPLIALPPRIGLAIVNGFTLSTASVLSYRYARHTFPQTRTPAILALLFVLFNPLPWMLVWLGQIEVMVLLGLVVMPVGIPFLFAKPHLGPWAALGSRRDLVWLIAMTAISLLLYGFWPEYLLAHVFDHRIPHPISMGWGTIHPVIGAIGLILLPFTNRDPLRLMAVGSLISPFMMPYHYYVMLPSLGRTRGYRQIALWIASWSMIAVTGWQTVQVKTVALVFPLMVWFLLAPALRPREILADPDTLLNRAVSTLRWAKDWLARQYPAGE